MKSIFSITFLLLHVITFSEVSAKTIFAKGEDAFFDLSGYDGRDGYRGTNCESGEDGEDGYNGDDALIYFKNRSDLKKIKLDMSGGQGGVAGQSGSRYNCDSSDIIIRAKDGYDGQLGYISLVEHDMPLVKEKKVQKVRLKIANKESLLFSSHTWKKVSGTQSLFHRDSNIRDQHRLFDRTVYTNIIVKLSDSVRTMNLDNLSLSVKYDIKYLKKAKLALFENKQKVNALIDYEFVNKDDSKTIFIKNIFYKKDIFDTSFVGSKLSGQETSLSLKDSHFLDANLENSFSFTLYKYHPFIDRFVIVGGVSSKFLKVTQDHDVITVNIGKANAFKNEFKAGSRYRVVINVQKSIGDNSLGHNVKAIFTIPK